MFGFKRKNEQDDTEMVLIPKKVSFLSRLAAFFKKDKSEEFYSDQSFYSLHSYVLNGVDNLGLETFDATVNLEGQEPYNFHHMKEIGLFQHPDGDDTKVIVADFEQGEASDGANSKKLRKICFEIPTNYILEEFLSNDGLYNLVKSGRLNINDLDYYKVNPVGRVHLNYSRDSLAQADIEDNSQEFIDYVDNKLTKKWLKEMKTEKEEQETDKQQKDVDRMFDAPEVSSAFDSKETQQENRINDNNIRVAPGKKAIYFTDPDDGKTIVLDELTKVNSVVHNDEQMSNLYIANYSTRGDFSDQESPNPKQKVAFELSDKTMEDLLKNHDEGLNFAFRTLFSETNVSQYLNADKLGDRHIGYLKKTDEGYRIILGSKTSKGFLNSLKLEKAETLTQNSNPISTDDDDAR